MQRGRAKRRHTHFHTRKRRDQFLAISLWNRIFQFVQFVTVYLYTYNYLIYVIYIYIYIWAPFFCLLVRQVHTRPVQHARLVYIYIYIYIYVYIRRACLTGSRVYLVTKIPKYPPKCFVRKLFTLLGIFSISGGRFVSTFWGRKISLTYVNI